MLSPKAELEDLVLSLDEVTATDRSHISVSEARAKVAKAIRITHAILSDAPEPGDFDLRLALVELDRGSPQPRINI